MMMPKPEFAFTKTDVEAVIHDLQGVSSLYREIFDESMVATYRMIDFATSAAARLSGGSLIEPPIEAPTSAALREAADASR